MANSPASGPSRRRGLAKYVRRLTAVFKRDKVAPPTTLPPRPVALTGLLTHHPPVQRSEPDEKANEVISATSVRPATAIAETLPPAATISASPAARSMNRTALQQERALALFAKYGLPLESRERITMAEPTDGVQWVERSVRMRVHRACHHCGCVYGVSKVCVQCGHGRCKKCPRRPVKRPQEERARSREKPKRTKPLAITTRSGKELTYRPARQTVRRTCHKCSSLFLSPGASTCGQCRHIRCTRCPREPAKAGKWPKGYPSDVLAVSDSESEQQPDSFRRTWRKPRARIRWECESCHTVFLNASSLCSGCGHERCSACIRSPMKRVKKEEPFDPVIVAAVEVKLQALAISDDTATSGAEAM